MPGIFRPMKPIKDAVKSYRKLANEYDVYILSTSPWENDTAPGDKLNWVKEFLGEPAKKRLILSHHKNLNKGDFLIDNRTKNGYCPT